MKPQHSAAEPPPLVWQKSFDFSFPREDVYRGYLEVEGPREPVAGASFTLTDSAGTLVEITDVREHEYLAWTEKKGDATAEMTAAFESTASGSRITVTRYGFGEGIELEIFRESHMLGWTEGMRDLELYLRTGVLRRRHLEDRSATGVMFVERPAGLEVVTVVGGSLGAEAGLQPGDVLLTIDGAAIYDRGHLWFVQRLYEPGREVELVYLRGGERLTGRGRMSPIDLATTGEIGLGPRLDQ